MKILETRYPLGSFPGQQTAGRYIDKTYFDNLAILAKAITRDMTFMGIISSSTLEVGTGKSVFVQQTGEAWIELVKQIHQIDLPLLNMSNIVFKPKDLIERAFKVPRYSVVILDEWEDAHYWSELGVSLRQFFRKCRQLNLFMLVIIPNFFQLPINYAIARSIFFIDIRFEGEFERGFFRYFSFERKKDLYINGKKTQDYNCVKPNFIGRFGNGYVVDEKQYRAAKLRDLDEVETKSKPIDEKKIKIKIFREVHARLPKVTIIQLAQAFCIAERTAYDWLKDDEESEGNEENAAPAGTHHTLLNLNQGGDNHQVEVVTP